MSERPDARIFNTVAERLHSSNPVKAIAEVALTGVGFFHPPREKLYRTTRKLLRGTDETIPLQPPVEDIAHAIVQLLSDSEPIQTPRLDDVQLTRFVNTMVQFSDRSATAEAMATPASQVDQLY